MPLAVKMCVFQFDLLCMVIYVDDACIGTAPCEYACSHERAPAVCTSAVTARQGEQFRQPVADVQRELPRRLLLSGGLHLIKLAVTAVSGGTLLPRAGGSKRRARTHLVPCRHVVVVRGQSVQPLQAWTLW